MADMVDRIARTIALDQGHSWMRMSETEKDKFRSTACEILYVMREPTPAMVDFGEAVRGNHADYPGGNGTENIFRAMISEAMKNG